MATALGGHGAASFSLTKIFDPRLDLGDLLFMLVNGLLDVSYII